MSGARFEDTLRARNGIHVRYAHPVDSPLATIPVTPDERDKIADVIEAAREVRVPGSHPQVNPGAWKRLDVALARLDGTDEERDDLPGIVPGFHQEGIG